MYLVIAVTSDDMDITVKSMMSPSPIPAESFTVLVVTADSARLAMMSTTLSSLGYRVLTASTTSEAISIAQNKQDLNLVLTDVHLPDMNKYEHLEKMKAVSNAPLVIMYDDDKISKLHSLFKESIFYILSSLTKESLKNLRKFAFNKNKDVVMKDVPKQQSDVHVESRDGRMKSSRVKSEEISDWEEKNSNDSTTFPKRRQVWTKELHQRFVMAVRQLGVNGAHPKQILELMKVTGLRRRCVASHLQKYRMAWRQEQVALQQKQIKASNSEKYQSYQYVPTSNFQGGLPRLTQLPNLYSTYTPYQQELHVLNNHNGLVHTTPIFGSAYNPIHLDSSGSEPTNNRNWQPTPRNQLAYTYSNAENIGAESRSNKNLAADFGDMGSFSKKIFQEQNNNFSTEVFQEQNNFSSIVDNGSQNLTHFPVHHSVQQQPSLPPIQEQEDSNFVGETEPSILPSLIFTSADYEQGDGLLELGEEMLDFDDINFNDLLF